MIDVTPELLSRYADGQVSADEAVAVEARRDSDPAIAAQLAEFEDLAALFGAGPEEPVPDELLEALCALRPAPVLEAFEAVPTAAPSRRRSVWLNAAMAAAAVALVAVGIGKLTYRPEVALRDFVRQKLAADGGVLRTYSDRSVTMRTGETIRTAGQERISFRMPDGSRVVLQPETEVELGDPRDQSLFEIGAGTALCSVLERGRVRTVRAGAYVLHMDSAEFGVRVQGSGVRAAGATARGSLRVTVAVTKGSLEVGENGARETVEPEERIVLTRGRPTERSRAYADPIYKELLGGDLLGRDGYEILPGYFSAERGVRTVLRKHWTRQRDGALVHAVSDTVSIAGATHLVLYARAARPTALAVTRLRPTAGTAGTADASTVRTGIVGTEWTVVSVPRAAFTAEGAERETRKIPAGRSGLVRLELRPVEQDTEIELKASLWAARPPAETSEAKR